MKDEDIRQLICELLLRYRLEAGAPELWREPIVKFTDAGHPKIPRLRELVHPTHHLPTDFLDRPTVIPVYFLPFSLEVINSNLGGYYASELWTSAYAHSCNAIRAIDGQLVEAIKKEGWQAAIPAGTSYVTPTTYRSSWSHRHIGYLGGLGTFGMNNLMITDRGCCGYCSSIITNLPIAPTKELSRERCLYKRNGSCGLCLKNCVGGALSAGGFHREKCHAMVMRTERYYEQKGVSFVNEADACGKCAAGLPCSACDPTAKITGG